MPEVPRSPSGFSVGPAEGVRQNNLITDAGMDDFAVSSVLSGAAQRTYLAVGTGSTAPDVSDTALDTEVQRDNDSGGFTTFAASSDVVVGPPDLLRVELVVNKVVTMTANRNLTEFGFARTSGGNILIRELLRDGGGNPITVSLLDGKRLRVEHTLRIELPFDSAGQSASIDIEEYDAGNNLIATTPYNITHGLSLASTTNANARMAGFVTWDPTASGTNPGNGGRAAGSAYSYSRSGFSLDNFGLGSTFSSSGVAMEPYTPGTFQRIKRFTFPTSSANGDIHALAMATYHGGTASAFHAGYVIQFDSPSTYTKVNTDTLRFGLVSTWARA